MLKLGFPGVLWACLLVPLGLSAQALTLEQILPRYYEAMGGLAALDKIQTIRIRASMAGQDGTVELTLFKKKPDKVRLVMNRPGFATPFIQASNGQTAWWLRPGASPENAVPMPPDKAAQFMRDAPIASALINWQERGVRLEYRGVVDLGESLRCHHIEAHFPDGQQVSYYLDVETYLERRIVSRTTLAGRIAKQVTIPSDYRRVAGVLVAHRVINRQDDEVYSTILVEDVAINIGIFDAFFDFPGQLAPPEDL